MDKPNEESIKYYTQMERSLLWDQVKIQKNINLIHYDHTDKWHRILYNSLTFISKELMTLEEMKDVLYKEISILMVLQEILTLDSGSQKLIRDLIEINKGVLDVLLVEP